MMQSLENEIHVMKELKGENVVHIFDVFKTNTEIYMMIEFCSEGDLDGFIKKHGGHLGEDVAIHYLRQIMEGFR